MTVHVCINKFSLVDLELLILLTVLPLPVLACGGALAAFCGPCSTLEGGEQHCSVADTLHAGM